MISNSWNIDMRSSNYEEWAKFADSFVASHTRSHIVNTRSNDADQTSSSPHCLKKRREKKKERKKMTLYSRALTLSPSPPHSHRANAYNWSMLIRLRHRFTALKREEKRKKKKKKWIYIVVDQHRDSRYLYRSIVESSIVENDDLCFRLLSFARLFSNWCALLLFISRDELHQ